MKLMIIPAIALVIIVGSAAVLADVVPQVEVIPVSSKGKVTAQIKVNGESVANILTSNGNLSPTRRAEIAVERIKAILASKPRPWKVTAAVINGKISVAYNNSVILIATNAEAQAHGLSRQRLADIWAGNLSKMLNLPPLALNPEKLLIPLGESRAVATSGYLESPVTVTDPPGGVTRSEFDAKTRSIRVRGESVGSAVVEVRCADSILRLPVEVKKYAGRLGTAPVMTLTGRPAPGDLIEEAVRGAITQCAIPEDGATCRLVSISAPKELEPGKEIDAAVKLAFSGPGYIPVEVSGKVRIRNTPLSPLATTKLLYSNSPERLLKYGTLYVGQVAAGEPARLLYHHQNMMGRPVRLYIEVLNPGSTPAQVQVIDGSTAPMIDTVLVGFNAARNYFNRYLNDVGYIAELPPASSIRLVTQTLPHQYTSSGIIGLRQIAGTPLTVVIQAADETWSVRNLTPNMNISPIVFPQPVKEVDATYTVGKQWAFIRIGKHPITNGTPESLRLDGNYGVIYNLNIQVNNPTNTRRRVEVLFEATAGPSRALFLNGREMISIRHTAAPQEERVLALSLEPGESRRITLQTMPLAGSAYPATIIVKS